MAWMIAKTVGGRGQRVGGAGRGRDAGAGPVPRACHLRAVRRQRRAAVRRRRTGRRA